MSFRGGALDGAMEGAIKGAGYGTNEGSNPQTTYHPATVSPPPAEASRPRPSSRLRG